jgi:hypothetical protein
MEIIVLTAIGILSRLMPHLPNVTAVGSLTLFTASRYGLKKSLVVTFAIMLITDLIVGLHPVMWATYGSFIISAVMGRFLLVRRNMVRVAGVTLTSSIIFFILTNFAVWLVPGSMYPKTVMGLAECYMMALPFFRNTLTGDAIYGIIFFGGYEAVRIMAGLLAKQES